jgi:hypothetical protein
LTRIRPEFRFAPAQTPAQTPSWHARGSLRKTDRLSTIGHGGWAQPLRQGDEGMRRGSYGLCCWAREDEAAIPARRGSHPREAGGGEAGGSHIHHPMNRSTIRWADTVTVETPYSLSVVLRSVSTVRCGAAIRFGQDPCMQEAGSAAIRRCYNISANHPLYRIFPKGPQTVPQAVLIVPNEPGFGVLLD